MTASINEIRREMDSNALTVDSLMPNSHRRRDETVELSRRQSATVFNPLGAEVGRWRHDTQKANIYVL